MGTRISSGPGHGDVIKTRYTGLTCLDSLPLGGVSSAAVLAGGMAWGQALGSGVWLSWDAVGRTGTTPVRGPHIRSLGHRAEKVCTGPILTPHSCHVHGSTFGEGGCALAAPFPVRARAFRGLVVLPCEPRSS